MDETLRQLGGLLLGAVPTIILFLAVYGAYTVLVHRPLLNVLGERRNRTEGAVEKARAAIARRQQALEAREAALADARTRAHEEVEIARAGIAQEKARAQAGLEEEAQSLAGEIIRVVLEPALAQPSAGGADD